MSYSLRRIVPNMYVDDIIRKAVAISNGITRMFILIGLAHFMSLKCNTFARTTLQFLSTFEVKQRIGAGCIENNVSIGLLITTMKLTW